MSQQLCEIPLKLNLGWVPNLLQTFYTFGGGSNTWTIVPVSSPAVIVVRREACPQLSHTPPGLKHGGVFFLSAEETPVQPAEPGCFGVTERHTWQNFWQGSLKVTSWQLGSTPPPPDKQGTCTHNSQSSPPLLKHLCKFFHSAEERKYLLSKLSQVDLEQQKGRHDNTSDRGSSKQPHNSLADSPAPSDKHGKHAHNSCSPHSLGWNTVVYSSTLQRKYLYSWLGQADLEWQKDRQ